MYIKKSIAVLCAVALAVVSYLLGAFLGLPLADKDSAAGDISKTQTVPESVVTAKVPKKLDTFVPFWGVPQPKNGSKQVCQTLDDLSFYRSSETAFPEWISWNLDLATEASQRYKFGKFLAEGQSLPCNEMLCNAIDECYRWAWRKPYGNTNVVMGPLFTKQSGNEPYAYFVAVCKQERLKTPMPLGYSSIGFLLPLNAEVKNVYEYSLSVNALEYKSGYNLFCKLPSKVQSQVKEMTAYELLCSFQEIEPTAEEMLQPEVEQADNVDNIRIDTERNLN